MLLTNAAGILGVMLVTQLAPLSVSELLGNADRFRGQAVIRGRDGRGHLRDGPTSDKGERPSSGNDGPQRDLPPRHRRPAWAEGEVVSAIEDVDSSSSPLVVSSAVALLDALYA